MKETLTIVIEQPQSRVKTPRPLEGHRSRRKKRYGKIKSAPGMSKIAQKLQPSMSGMVRPKSRMSRMLPPVFVSPISIQRCLTDPSVDLLARVARPTRRTRWQMKKAANPLPWFQFSIILFLQLAEPLTSQVIYPFAPQVFLELCHCFALLTVPIPAYPWPWHYKWRWEESGVLCRSSGNRSNTALPGIANVLEFRNQYFFWLKHAPFCIGVAYLIVSAESPLSFSDCLDCPCPCIVLGCQGRSGLLF